MKGRPMTIEANDNMIEVIKGLTNESKLISNNKNWAQIVTDAGGISLVMDARCTFRDITRVWERFSYCLFIWFQEASEDSAEVMPIGQGTHNDLDVSSESSQDCQQHSLHNQFSDGDKWFFQWHSHKDHGLWGGERSDWTMCDGYLSLIGREEAVVISERV